LVEWFAAQVVESAAKFICLTVEIGGQGDIVGGGAAEVPRLSAPAGIDKANDGVGLLVCR